MNNLFSFQPLIPLPQICSSMGTDGRGSLCPTTRPALKQKRKSKKCGGFSTQAMKLADNANRDIGVS
jgi:hypothetical protein